jgi:hypothetical protein
VILRSDEHKLTELVPFALMRGRMIGVFLSFLRWSKQHLRMTDADLDSESTLRVFVVDRQDGHLAALQEMFPKSGILFCSKHLGENMGRTTGNQPEALEAF